ncbi:MAG: hypothetical protein J6R74_05045 [Tidjanibacter sp.]|nr:hypothetical protein [Tidjanibacter sp.]
MKKMMKTWALVAVAAMGLTACQNEIDEQIEANDTVTVTLVDETDSTRTSVNTNGSEPKFSWGDEETFAVLEQTDALAQAKSVTFAKVSGKAQIDAEFAVNGGKSEYKYVAIYPQKGFIDGSSLESVSLSLPANQTMATDSYDPAADLMVSKVVSTDAQPTEAQMVQFYRMAAVAKLTLKNFNLELGDQVKSVIFAADDKQLAGKITANLLNPEEYTVAEGSSSVTVATTSKDVYFTLLPTTLEAGNTYSVIVLTDKYLYVKKGVIPADKSLEFAAGNVTRFSVNMSDIAPSDKWVLVKDASTLKQGDIVTIAAKNYNYALGKMANNYPLASQTEVVKVGDYLYHPVATASTSVDNRLQALTLMQRDSSKAAFDFYNGEDYDGDTSVGFIFANGSNYSPKLQSFCDKNTQFVVSIADGAATVEASQIEKSYKWWRYYHSTSASSRRFDCTTSVPTGNYQICIYKLEGGVGTIPTVAANVTVPKTNVVIAEEGAAEATAISEVVFNYVGDWTIKVESAEKWLNVAYDATKGLTYTAEVNTGAKRTATVTITATLEGEDALTWSFTVLQKGAPQEISIADFAKLAKDENSTYKLTGKVTTLATSSSSAYVLSDENGNVANIKYLYTEAGEAVWGHDDFEVKLGDILTVTTVPMGSKNGGSSSYHSTYKGYYRLAVDPGVAADYTGGVVNISVKTSSHGVVTVPTTEVEGSMAECDFAEFSYSGGDVATVTFASENTTSDAREVSVTFTYGLASATVVAQQGLNPANKKGYELVTDASTLAAGDEVIIVAKNADKAIACPTSTSATSYTVAAIEKTGNVVYDAEKAGALVFTLEDDGDDKSTTMALSFTYSDGTTRYLSATSSTGLRSRDSINDSARFTIDITDTVAAIASPNKQVYFNSSTGTAFSANTSTNSNVTKEANFVCIYKKQK